METRVKSPMYAKKLRARLIELKDKRVRELADYKNSYIIWKEELLAWVKKNAKDRVEAISAADVKSSSASRWSRSERAGFTTENFFRGAPRPPIFPDDEQIRAVQKTLRFLAITGNADMRVDKDDIDKLFGDKE